MRTLQEKYNAVLEGNFSKTQFRRDAAMELPQFVSSVNSFDDTVTILKNKGIVTEAFGDEHQFGDTTYGDNQGLEVKSLAKQLYLGFKKMGARVRLDANRKKSPIGAEWGKDGLDQIDVLIWVGDSHKGYMVTIDLIGDKAMSFADKIMNDPKFSKFEFSKREIKTWGGQKGTELEVKPKVSKKGGVSVTEAKAQEPKYSTAKPADTIAPDVLDTGIKFELDKKYGTLDVTPEQYEQCRAMAAKNLAKDVLYYVKQDSEQLEAPAEQMEKVTLKEGKEEAWKEFQEKHNVTDKTIKVARKDFEKEWEAGNIEEAIQNIESDEQTKRRIAGLTNQLLQDADPRDETVKAYAISVKNDLESGDASRMSQYKDILSLDDLKADMEHYLSHDVDQLEEKDLSEPDAEDLYQHDDEYLAQLKQRKALKEMFKKIIVNLINE